MTDEQEKTFTQADIDLGISIIFCLKVIRNYNVHL